MFNIMFKTQGANFSVIKPTLKHVLDWVSQSKNTPAEVMYVQWYRPGTKNKNGDLSFLFGNGTLVHEPGLGLDDQDWEGGKALNAKARSLVGAPTEQVVAFLEEIEALPVLQ